MRTKQASNQQSTFKISGAHLGKVLVGISRGYIPSIEYTDREIGDIHIFGNADNGFKLHVKPYGHKSRADELQRLQTEVSHACSDRRALEVMLEESRNGYSFAKSGGYTEAMAGHMAKIEELEGKYQELCQSIKQSEATIKAIEEELEVGKFATQRYELDVERLQDLKVEVPVHGSL